jgi:uncharacterized protein (DUF305 family)
MKSPRTFASALLAVATAASPMGAAPTSAPPSAESLDRAFLADNVPVMDRMMAGMTITSSHDVDRDFAAMMIPHHQGAIEMAVLELRYGRNEKLHRIAQEIIVEQQQEIVAMRVALGETPPPSAPTPDQPPATSATRDPR